MDEETEAWRDGVSCPPLQSWGSSVSQSSILSSCLHSSSYHSNPTTLQRGREKGPKRPPHTHTLTIEDLPLRILLV